MGSLFVEIGGISGTPSAPLFSLNNVVIMKNDIRIVFIGSSGKNGERTHGLEESGKTSLLSVIRDNAFPLTCPKTVEEFVLPVEDTPSVSTIRLNDSSCRVVLLVRHM